MNGEVLNSWKEIAAYMGRGVRTVQRWEQELALPVRRPRGKERSAVIALKSDLDRWLHSTPQGAATSPSADQRHTTLHLNTERLLAQTHEIIERSTRVQEAVKITLAIASRLKDQQAESIRARGARTEKQKLLLARAATLTQQIHEARGREASSHTALPTG